MSRAPLSSSSSLSKDGGAAPDTGPGLRGQAMTPEGITNTRAPGAFDPGSKVKAGIAQVLDCLTASGSPALKLTPFEGALN